MFEENARYAAAMLGREVVQVEGKLLWGTMMYHALLDDGNTIKSVDGFSWSLPREVYTGQVSTGIQGYLSAVDVNGFYHFAKTREDYMHRSLK